MERIDLEKELAQREAWLANEGIALERVAKAEAELDEAKVAYAEYAEKDAVIEDCAKLRDYLGIVVEVQEPEAIQEVVEEPAVVEAPVV